MSDATTIEHVSIAPAAGPGRRHREGSTVQGIGVFIDRNVVSEMKKCGWTGRKDDRVWLTCMLFEEPDSTFDLMAVGVAPEQVRKPAAELAKTEPFRGNVVIHVSPFEPTPYRGVCEGFPVDIAGVVYRELPKIANEARDLFSRAEIKGHFVFECHLAISSNELLPYRLHEAAQVSGCLGSADEHDIREYRTVLERYQHELRKRAARQ